MPGMEELQYSNISELHRKRFNYNGRKPQQVSNTLPNLKNAAEEARKEGNEENAYILFMRWLDGVEWIQRTREYKNNKSHYLANIQIDQIDEVKAALAELRKSLESRYKLKREAVSRKETDRINNRMDVDLDSGELPLKLPETPTDDPLNEESDDFVTCVKLFQILQRTDPRCLIIDVREREDYQCSRILFKVCVNIPASKIDPGKTTSTYLKYLLNTDKEAFELFKQRSQQYVDIVVLMDWNTTQDRLSPSNPLSILKEILVVWDPGVKYKKIAMLQGGYVEWLERYPAFTTNPKPKIPEASEFGDELMDIEYPEWLHEDEEKKPEAKRSNIEIREEYRRPGRPLERPKLEKDVRSIVPLSGEDRRNGEAINRSNEVIMKPTVDRSSKPVLPKTDPRAKTVLMLMKRRNDLLKERERLEQDILEREFTLYAQRGRNRGLVDENHLETLCFQLDEVQNQYEETEMEVKRYNDKTNLIRYTSTEEDWRNKLNLDLVMTRRRLQTIAMERKKLKEEKEKRDAAKRTEDEEVIYKEPLKNEGTPLPGGLERSHSSPNLLKLGDRKAPQVDRSSKPQVPSHNQQNGFIDKDPVKVPRISWGNREERMTPIHGSVHPGITGLKNLGNSCYMNSIIQCLSNTTHLAKYFTDNSYADDLNNADTDRNEKNAQVVEEVAQVIKALWRGQYKSISPHDLKIAVGQYKLQFESYEQQDSHEFLTFLLDWMHNDLKKESKLPVDSNMSVAEKEWDKAMGSQRSIISDLFFGQLRSTIACSYCKQASTTYETFNSLTMSLSHSNRCTLTECIQKFVTGQKVVGWKCPKCQTAREATKKFDFVKLAPIVVIHLNRFAESGGWLEKRNTAVDFPLTGFNLKPYLVSNGSNSLRNYNYNLYAMSNHYGTMDGGHYTAFCKNAAQNKWYKYDDQTVTEVSASQVKSQNTSAYLLFYSSFPSTYI